MLEIGVEGGDVSDDGFEMFLFVVIECLFGEFFVFLVLKIEGASDVGVGGDEVGVERGDSGVEDGECVFDFVDGFGGVGGFFFYCVMGFVGLFVVGGVGGGGGGGGGGTFGRRRSRGVVVDVEFVVGDVYLCGECVVFNFGDDCGVECGGEGGVVCDCDYCVFLFV